MTDQTKPLKRPGMTPIDASSDQDTQLAFKNMFAKLVDDYRQEYLIARPTNGMSMSPPTDAQS